MAMDSKPTFPAIFVATGGLGGAAMDALNKATMEWELRAARGECQWICADCCCSFSEGMPDACAHGHQSCTELIQRDKREAAAKTGDAA